MSTLTRQTRAAIRGFQALRLDIIYWRVRKTTERNKLKGPLMGLLPGTPLFLIGSAMGMLKEEQFGEDSLLRPRMAVASHGKVAAPAENANNAKFEKKTSYDNC